MKQVKMLVQLSGLRDEEPWPAVGAVVEFPVDEADQLVALKLATDEFDVPVVEAAVAPSGDVETAAVVTTPRKRAAKKAAAPKPE